jgi:hypothetical protein
MSDDNITIDSSTPDRTPDNIELDPPRGKRRRSGSERGSRRVRHRGGPYEDVSYSSIDDREMEDGLNGLANAYNEDDGNNTVGPTAGAPAGVQPKKDIGVAVPLFNYKWGDDTDADDFCFLCNYSEDGTKAMSNQWYMGLKKLVDAEDIPLFSRCHHILEYYERNLRPYSIDKKEWTIRAIRDHLVHHGGLGTQACIDDLKLTQYALIRKIVDSGIVMKKADGTEQINTKGVMTVNRMMHTYMMLARSREKGQR